MSDSVIQLAGSPRSVFVAWQSLKKSSATSRQRRDKQKPVAEGRLANKS